MFVRPVNLPWQPNTIVSALPGKTSAFVSLAASNLAMARCYYPTTEVLGHCAPYLRRDILVKLLELEGMVLQLVVLL